MSYRQIIESISIGSNDKPKLEMTEEQANDLLKIIAKEVDAKQLKSGSYESQGFFLYVSEFPCYGVSIGNRSGTDLLYLIFNNVEWDRMKGKIIKEHKRRAEYYKGR